MNIISAVVLIPFFLQLFGDIGPFPVSKLDSGKGAVTFQSIVKFCAQRNDTRFKKRDDVINNVTEKLVNMTRDQNKNKTRDKDTEKQRSNVMTTRDSEGHRHLTSSRNSQQEALMVRVCPVLTRLDDDGGDGPGSDEIEEIVNEILLTLFWDLHSLIYKNRATAEGEAYVNGKHYDLNELMASCCSFG